MWSLNELSPFESKEIILNLEFNTPTDDPPLNDGDELSFSATVASNQPDHTPLNNIHHLYQTVTNSFDPNDKNVFRRKHHNARDDWRICSLYG